ncbi:gamma-aminobutyric acid type B receptor subunit 2-like isoform X2 [Phyllopteryx taeniolatus]|uniref:gamma-aminobutyric acid type B receptor subunit 2-like isoform X2 n=1 Tax=Phyllopteryx taeniolatus TaxID=161469 RepID=UPI002AD55922|nr:gamma-aminobutyric acid type B receptor subunit 2-like isoform X2 [Phyllopteryx taeniolatus]
MALFRVPPLLGVLLVVWRAAAGSVPPPPVPVLWMLPGSSGGGRANASAGTGTALALAVRMALDDLDGRATAPLGRYRIRAHVIHAQCDLSSSLRSLFDAMWAGPRYRLLLGGACPSVATRLARALPALRMVQMTKDLMNRMTTAGVQPVSTTALPDHDCGGLVEMKQLDVRVVVIVLTRADEDSLARVFCCASGLKMFGARHRWMVAGAEPTRRSGSRVPGCGSRDVAAAADGAIWLLSTHVAHADTPGVSGRTRQDFERAYLREVRLRPGLRASPLAAYAYDAAWAAAIALSRLTEALERRRKFHRNADIGEEEATGALRDAVARTHFQGVTGPVSFRRGRRRSSVLVFQTQGSAGVTVGEVDTTTDQLRLSERLLKFKGPSSVPDGGIRERRRVGVLVYGVLSAVATVTAAVSLGVLCGAAAKRRRLGEGSAASATASRDAPMTTTMAVFLSASSVVAAGPDGDDFLARETADALCSLRACLLCASHTLASASLLARTWRRASGGGEVPSAFRLAILMTSVDALLLCAWQTPEVLGRAATRHVSPPGKAAAAAELLGSPGVCRAPQTVDPLFQSDSAQPDAFAWTTSKRCGGNNGDAWTAALCAYKAPLVVVGCLLSWLLPDGSRGTCACPACALWASVSVASAPPLLSRNPSLDFCVVSVLVLACDIIVLAAAFLRNPVDSGADSPPAAGGGPREKRNRLLKHQSAELDTQIHTLTTQLCVAREAELVQHQTGSSDTTSHDLADGDVNSPELVRRRLSVQLPILHLSYLPVVGGVSASSSARFAGGDAADA